MEQSIDARAGWGQEAREPNKLACQTLDEGNVRKKVIFKKGHPHTTNLVSGPQDIKQAWSPGVGPPGLRTPGTEWRKSGRSFLSGGILMTKYRPRV